MSKKQKRSVSQNAESVVVVKQSTGRAPISSAEFNPDYSYVVKDLKRIGMLAGSFFVVLIALSFILN